MAANRFNGKNIINVGNHKNKLLTYEISSYRP